MIAALDPRDTSVLVVEDSPNDQEITKRALKTFGIRDWHVAGTAEDALFDLRKRRYDIALVDYRLPGLNGLQLIEQLRQVDGEMRVILVTGTRQDIIAAAAMKLGASDYVPKDEYLTGSIVRALQAVLRGKLEKDASVQRAAVSGGDRKLQEASVEAIWLIQALDERHGYASPASNVRDPLAEEYSDAVATMVDYLRRSCEAFPQPATDEEDALLRAVIKHGMSPRDLFRLYSAALRSLLAEQRVAAAETPIRPVLFLAHVLACLLEHFQVMLSLNGRAGSEEAVAAGAAGEIDARPRPWR